MATVSAIPLFNLRQFYPITCSYIRTHLDCNHSWPSSLCMICLFQTLLYKHRWGTKEHRTLTVYNFILSVHFPPDTLKNNRCATWMSYYAPCHSFTSRIITGATLNHNIICPHTAVIICRLLYPRPEITPSWSGDSEISYSISGGFSLHENYLKTQCLIFISVSISLSQSEISSSKGSFWRPGFQLNSD